MLSLISNQFISLKYTKYDHDLSFLIHFLSQYVQNIIIPYEEVLQINKMPYQSLINND